MGAEACDGNHLSDLAGMGDVSRQNGALVMQPLRVVDHIFLPGLLHLFPGGGQLLQGGEGSLVGKIILAGVHGPQAQGAALAGDGGPGDHHGLRVLQHFLLTVGGPGLGKRLQEGGHLPLVRVIDILEGAAGLRQAVAHAVDMAVVQPDGGEHEFPVLHHRLRSALGGIGHSIRYVH